MTRFLPDPAYQLTQAGYPSAAPYNGEVHTWTYDGIGNRTSAGSSLGAQRLYTYFKNGSNPLNGQRLQSDGVSTYGYDANGNTTSRTGSPGAFTFGWDAEDRMISIAGGVSASYSYDYQGRRTSKTVGGASSTYLYDGLNLVRTTGADQVDVLFGPGIDEPLAMAHNGSVYYFSVDGLGSVVLLTTSGGAVQNASLYDAWGERRHQSGSLPQPFAYTAREPAEAGLWFYRARYYQPGIGRFGSEDPLGQLADNLYSYVSSEPILFTDPTGLMRICLRRFNWGPAGYLNPARHCYVQFDTGTTITYDNHGAHADAAPDTWFRHCFDVDNSDPCCNEDCVRKAMMDHDDPSAPAHGYHFFKHNCCDAARDALKRCKCGLPWQASTANMGL